jgi:hypothetical protein
MIKFRFDLLHPFLVIFAPILFIASQNLSEAPGKEILSACIVGGIFSGLILFITHCATKKIEFSAFITSFFIILLFSYGPIYDLTHTPILNELFLSASIFFILTTFFVTLSFWVTKHTKILNPLNRFIGISSGLMLTMSVVNVLKNPIFITKLEKIPTMLCSKFIAKTSPSPHPDISYSLSAPPPYYQKGAQQEYPDIYYVILDGYARSDILQKIYHHDNTYFENELTEKGFYIAQKSTSNYPMTHLSLASSLNMEHINALAAQYGSKNCEPYYTKIKTPRVAALLKEKGYEYLTISSGWGPTGHASPYSDIHYDTKLSSLSNYHRSLLAMTPLKGWIGSSEAKLRLFSLQKLKTLSALEHQRPKFVFLHLVMPHAPYYFDSHGNIKNMTKTDYRHRNNKQDYIEQLKFLNQKINDVVGTIIQNSPRSIIILQADHGSESTLENFLSGPPSLEQITERFSIFNAYYGPEELQKLLYNSITPVNSFRLVLNSLKIGHWELLPDNNYFQWYNDSSGILEVTSQLNSYIPKTEYITQPTIT